MLVINNICYTYIPNKIRMYIYCYVKKIWVMKIIKNNINMRLCN